MVERLDSGIALVGHFFMKTRMRIILERNRSLVECCILPVLMYGSESWMLNSTLLSTLESFQAELGKRILKLPKFTSNNILKKFTLFD